MPTEVTLVFVGRIVAVSAVVSNYAGGDVVRTFRVTTVFWSELSNEDPSRRQVGVNKYLKCKGRGDTNDVSRESERSFARGSTALAQGSCAELVLSRCALVALGASRLTPMKGHPVYEIRMGGGILMGRRTKTEEISG